MFACQECGKKFRTVKAAERAQDKGCTKCGGTDIDLDVPAKKAPTATPKRVYADPRDPMFNTYEA